jgi:hypothetical protein
MPYIAIVIICFKRNFLIEKRYTDIETEVSRLHVAPLKISTGFMQMIPYQYYAMQV